MPRPALAAPLAAKLTRNALLGFVAACVSDCCSNSIRVLKTTVQTHETPIGYPTALRMVVEKDGVIGLFTRGLGTRVIANGAQGMMFAVLWKYFEGLYNGSK